MVALAYGDVDINFLLDLLSLGDQFIVDSLKNLCENAIQREIRIENVCLMLTTADMRGAKMLKKRCLSFIMSHFAKVIVHESFVDMPKQVLREVLAIASVRGVVVPHS